MQKSERIHGMDALRAIAMFLGVVLHAAMSYQINSSRKGWPIDHYSTSIFFDYLYLYIHSFRMPLFFLVAGFFCQLLCKKVGTIKFLQKRINRIVIPFLISIIIIIPLTTYPFLLHENYYVNKLPYSLSLKVSLNGLLHWQGFHHLWFLYYLIIYYSIIIGLKEASSYIKHNRWKIPNFFICSLFICCVIWIISSTLFDGNIEAWTGVSLKTGPLLYYFLFFVIGILMHDKWAEIRFNRFNTWLLFILGSLLNIFSTYLNFTDFVIETIYKDLINSIATISLVFGSLGIFINYLNRRSYVLQYLSDSAYWIYLIHLSLVIFLQIILIDLPIDSFIKFSIVLITSYGIGLFSYHKFVRYSLIGFLLHGSRIKTRKKLLKT